MTETQSDVLKEPSRKLRWLLFLLIPKVAIPLIILLALLAAPFMYRMHQINKLPDIGDPFDVEAFGTVEIPDEENAYVEYRAAGKLLVELKGHSKIHDELDKALEEGWSAATDDIRNWVNDNRPAMDLWRKGTEKPNAVYHQPKTYQVLMQLPVTQHLRDFARLAIIEGSRLEEESESENAWAWYRAMYRSSRHSGRYGGIIERFSGGAIQSMAANNIEAWSRNPQLSSEQLEQAIRQLKSDYQMTVSTSDVLKVEYLSLQKSFFADDMLEYVYFLLLERRGFPKSMRTPVFYFLGEPKLSKRVMQHVWQNQLDHIDKPFHQRPPRSSTVWVFLFDSSRSSGKGSHIATLKDIDAAFESSFLVRILIPAISVLDQTVLREQVRHRALLVVLAAQWYQRKHGEFPEKVEELLDGYLDEIPLDPHDVKGRELQYRRNVDGFTVWGLGQNGRDDGGRIGWDPNNDDFGFHVGNEEEKASP